MTANKVTRWAEPADFTALGEVMFAAVRSGPSLYSEAQRMAWVPEPRRGTAWDRRLAGQWIILQEAAGEVKGFMSLTPSGYIDFAYIRPIAQGTGVFRHLYAHIETRARDERITRLTTHASLMAQPAFAAIGFVVLQHEEVHLNGEAFARAHMAKDLEWAEFASGPMGQ